MPVYFDVGACEGNRFDEELKNDPNATVVAFEPDPRLADSIRKKYAPFPNYHVVEVAVSNYIGKTTFNCAFTGDFGTGSLCSFADGLDKTWPGREDFASYEQVEVDVIRLDEFCSKNGITEIDYLHVDAQGHDLEVLMGLGDMMRIVKEGCLEMPLNETVKLYKEQKYDVSDAYFWLIGRGFDIKYMDMNDPQGNEINIFFKKLPSHVPFPVRNPLNESDTRVMQILNKCRQVS